MTAPRLAWGLVGVFAAIAMAAIALVLDGRPVEDLFLLASGGYVLVGALVASRLPRNPIGWMLEAFGLITALGALADTNLRSPDAPLPTLSACLSAWMWYVWLGLAAVFLPLLFPDGRPLSPRWRPVAWLGGLAISLSVVGEATRPGAVATDSAVPVRNPLGVDGAPTDLLLRAGEVLMAVAFVLAAASLVVRFRRSRGMERQQLRWFAAAALLAAAGLLVATFQVLFGIDSQEQTPTWIEVIGAVGWFTALGAILLAVPIAMGTAILRHRLYDLDVVIRRALVYGGLTITLGAAYLGLVLTAGLAVGASSDLAVAGSTLAVAGLFGPLRARIQALVDRRFYRRRYDAQRTLEAFGSRLRDEVDVDALAAELRGVVGDTVQPAHVSLWLREPRA